MNMSLLVPPDELVERFRRDLGAITDVSGCSLGVAVSGGPDSLALLLLAAAAMPGRVEAATVDHGLRAGSAGEAVFVAELCKRMGVEHRTLALSWAEFPDGSLQARAREERYAALGRWAAERGVALVATAHHLDDQAETLLMRLARGAGVSGLASIRPLGPINDGVCVVRPLLGWLRQDLAAVVARTGISAVQDPANSDPRYDRTRARALLADTPWLEPARLAAAASHLRDAEAGLAWTTATLFDDRGSIREDGSVLVDAQGVPRELQRRLLLHALGRFVPVDDLAGPKVMRLLDGLLEKRAGTLAGIRVRPGPPWRLDRAPPRRDAKKR